ncbi:hypothetical protein SBDP1_220016 [Syntrophobacter sp. SbD1]|nr:hypothetical protein SBDP1_220016 [Syntrophobacter sp. SbD1]
MVAVVCLQAKLCTTAASVEQEPELAVGMLPECRPVAVAIPHNPEKARTRDMLNMGQECGI